MKILVLFVSFCFLLSCKNKVNKPTEKSSSEKHTNCSLLPRIESKSKINIAFNEISEENYKKGKIKDLDIIHEFSNSDSIEKVLIKKHPKLFLKRDSSFIFRYKNDSTVFLKNRIQTKSYSDYNIKGSYKDYIFVVGTGYESEITYALNLKNGKVYMLPGIPKFINDNFFYGYANSHGGEDIKIIDTYKNEDLNLYFDNMLVTDSYFFSNSIKLEFLCLKSNEKKYLSILKY